jgi:hypothetical protein
MINLIDAEVDFGENAEGLYLKHSQEIDQSFLDSLHSERLASAHMRAREMHKAASVPTFVHELWLRQGFDMTARHVTTRDIVRRLRSEGLDDFVATSKAV